MSMSGIHERNVMMRGEYNIDRCVFLVSDAVRNTQKKKSVVSSPNRCQTYDLLTTTAGCSLEALPLCFTCTGDL